MPKSVLMLLAACASFSVAGETLATQETPIGPVVDVPTEHVEAALSFGLMGYAEEVARLEAVAELNEAAATASAATLKALKAATKGTA